MKVLLLLLISTSVLASTAKMEEFRRRSKKEKWTFTFQESTREHHSTGLKKKINTRSSQSFRMRDASQIADRFDLRPKISPIQDQGSCGSCWAFSLTATLRDGYMIRGQDPGDLSEQYLVDCAMSASGCGGGYFDAADYLVRPKGSPSESELPYLNKDSRCENNFHPVASATSWHMIGTTTGPTVKDIEAYMTRSGRPVSVTVAAGAGPWENYASGIYNACEYAGTDHMINIVGWDNEGQTFDDLGRLPAGKGYWILRNSWGTSWGEKGWMRMRMTDSRGHRCNNIAEEAAFLDFDDNVSQTYVKVNEFVIIGVTAILLFLSAYLLKPNRASTCGRETHSPRDRRH